MLKRYVTLILSVILSFSAACGGNEPTLPENRNYGTAISDALNDRVFFAGDDLVLSAVAFDLVLQREREGYSLLLRSGEQTLAIGENPVTLYVAGKVSSMSADESVYQKTYDALYCSPEGLPVAVATVRTARGTSWTLWIRFLFRGKAWIFRALSA